MPRPKSFLLRLTVDQAGKAHNCQHNSSHRLQKGDVRLKVTEGRTDEHFCRECGLKFIDRDIAELQKLRAALISDIADN
jgi:hypothetical protein